MWLLLPLRRCLTRRTRRWRLEWRKKKKAVSALFPAIVWWPLEVWRRTKYRGSNKKERIKKWWVMKSLRILSLTAATLNTNTTGLARIITYLLLSMAILTNVKIGTVVQTASTDDHFKVVACLPEDSIGYTSQHLQNALSSWQENGGRITLSSGEIVEARNVALSISSVSIGNDTSSVLPLLCDAIEIHNPSLILSLLHEQTSFLVKTAAMTSSVPLLTWSRGYRQPSIYHHPVIYQFYSLKVLLLILLLSVHSYSNLLSSLWRRKVLVSVTHLLPP